MTFCRTLPKYIESNIDQLFMLGRVRRNADRVSGSRVRGRFVALQATQSSHLCNAFVESQNYNFFLLDERTISSLTFRDSEKKVSLRVSSV